MATNITLPTDEDVSTHISSLEWPKRRAESAVLVDLLRRVTAHEPVMWGPSIIGFGQYTYRYASGHGGTFAKVGFAPQKAKISLYGIGRCNEQLTLLTRLGKHKAAVGCVYVNRLDDVDLDVLEELFAVSYAGYGPEE